MFDKLAAVERQHEEIMQLLGSAEVKAISPSIGSRRKRCPISEPLVDRFREYKTLVRDIAQTEELAASADADMRELAQKS